MKKSKKFNKGFTLVEIMAVLVILGILATLAILNLNPVLDRANGSSSYTRNFSHCSSCKC